MDDKGRWMDNMMNERLWRSLKYECVYLHAFESVSKVSKGIRNWMDYYNQRRPLSSLDGAEHQQRHIWGLPRAGMIKAAA